MYAIYNVAAARLWDPDTTSLTCAEEDRSLVTTTPIAHGVDNRESITINTYSNITWPVCQCSERSIYLQISTVAKSWPIHTVHLHLTVTVGHQDRQ